MKAYDVTATKEINGEKKSATVVCNFGETAAENVEMFGDEVVTSNFIGSAKITLQANIRRRLEAGETQEKIAADLAGWKPGVAVARVADPSSAALRAFTKLDPEAQKELLKRLKAEMGKGE